MNSKINLFKVKSEMIEVIQNNKKESSLACLTMILNYHGKKYDLKELKDKYYIPSNDNLEDIKDFARREELIPMEFEIEEENVKHLNTPFIAQLHNGQYIIVEKIKSNKVKILNPSSGSWTYSYNDFLKKINFKICEFTKEDNFNSENKKEKKNWLSILSGVDDFWKDIFNIMIVAICLEIFVMVLPMFNKIVIDNIIVENNRDLLFSVGIGFLLLVFFRSIISWFRNYLLLFLSVKLQVMFKYNLLNKLFHLPMNYFETRGYGDILSRFESLDEIRKKLSTGLLESLISGVTLFISGLFMYYLNSVLFFILFSFLILILLIRALLLSQQIDKTEELVKNQASENGILIEILKTIEITKCHNEENRMFNNWNNKYIKFLNSMVSFEKLEINLYVLQQLLIELQRIIIVWVGAAYILNNEMTLGILFSFTLYQIIFSENFEIFIENIVELTLLKVHFNRINDIREQDNEKNTIGNIDKKIIEEKMKGKIELRNIYFKYNKDDEEYLFENYSLTIEAGESIVIVGKSGCGKSTLLKIISGLIPIENGDILIDGMNIKDLGLENYRNNIGMVLQKEDQLYTGTIEDNITLFEKNPKFEDVIQAAKKACIHDDIYKMKKRYNSEVRELGDTFSGGQVQRINLARVLYRNPKFLFIDEGTSALDNELEKEIIINLKKEKMTKISIAHREESKKLADRVIDLS
jgi:ATP-binding cassette subfamily B protein RaxB